MTLQVTDVLLILTLFSCWPLLMYCLKYLFVSAGAGSSGSEPANAHVFLPCCSCFFLINGKQGCVEAFPPFFYIFRCPAFSCMKCAFYVTKNQTSLFKNANPGSFQERSSPWGSVSCCFMSQKEAQIKLWFIINSNTLRLLVYLFVAVFVLLCVFFYFLAGLQSNRTVEGAFGSAEGHGGHASISAWRYEC